METYTTIIAACRSQDKKAQLQLYNSILQKRLQQQFADLGQLPGGRGGDAGDLSEGVEES